MTSGKNSMGCRQVLMGVRRVFAPAGLLALSLCGLAAAQGRVSTAADISAYAGPDRTERLMAGAKKEGTVTVYTSANVDDMAVLTSAF
jgi:iron(III) transport system substrate-binding protein